MNRCIWRGRRVWLLVAIGLFASSISPRPVAASTYCRSDPTVVLSNGAVIDLQAGINDSLSDVKNVAYTVHIPVGLRVVGIVKTGSLMGLVETVTVYADDAANTYDSSTTVTTRIQRVAVTASTTVVSALGVTLGSKATSGLSGQTLRLHFTTLL